MVVGIKILNQQEVKLTKNQKLRQTYGINLLLNQLRLLETLGISLNLLLNQLRMHGVLHQLQVKLPQQP